MFVRRRLCSWKFARPLINPRELSCLSTSAAYTCLRVSFRDDRSGSHHVSWQPLRRHRWFLRIVFEDEVKAPCRVLWQPPPCCLTNRACSLVAGVLSSNEKVTLCRFLFSNSCLLVGSTCFPRFSLVHSRRACFHTELHYY